MQASSVGLYGNLGAISDNRRPNSSHDISITPWISSSEENNHFIEIDVKDQQIRSFGVYWFIDNKTVLLPAEWVVEYKKDGIWLPFEIYVTDHYGIKPDHYNIIYPAADLICEAIRIKIVSQDQKPVGILDVDVAF